MDINEITYYKESLEKEINLYNGSQNSEGLVQILNTINALWKKEIPQINDEFENFVYNGNLLFRSANTILALLSSKLISIREEIDLNKILYTEIDESFTQEACDILGATNYGLTTNNIYYWCNYYSDKFKQEIPIEDNDKAIELSMPNKRTILFQNLRVFNSIQKFIIIKELCELKTFKSSTHALELKSKLLSRYEHLVRNNSPINNQLINNTVILLNNYKKSQEQFNQALNKFNSKIYNRNTLDDIRLSFELLLKEIFNNHKSLENQKTILGQFFDEKGISKESKNMIMTLIQYYTLFHNNHVKHDSSYNENEIEFIIEQTSVIMNLLVKINK